MTGLLVFTIALVILLYHHLGYPLLLGLRARRRPRRPTKSYSGDSGWPAVSLVISAYNEEEVLAAKLENATALNYPAGLLEIVVASDGSTDGTGAIAHGFAGRGVRLLEFSPNRGKNLVLNEVLPRLRSEIVVFTDANGMYHRDALRALIAPFADAAVGSTCGELVYQNYNENPIAEGYNRYWEFDQLQKRLESDAGTLLGANGSIFAVRRALCRPIPNDVCNDMVQPILVAAEGHLCVYEPRARSFEAGSRDLADELRRRSRIIGRGIRGIAFAWPTIVTHRAWAVGWELVSRKGLRYLMPLWFLLLLAGSGLAGGPILGTFFWLQLAGYAAIPVAARLPEGRLSRLASPLVYFGIGNLAAIQGWGKVLAGSELGRWQTAERPFEGESTNSTPAAGLQ